MELKKAADLMKKYAICLECGNDEGEVQVLRDTFSRICPCGWTVQIYLKQPKEAPAAPVMEIEDKPADHTGAMFDTWITEENTELKPFEIWSEGFRANGECSSGAHHHGSAQGIDFCDACDRFAAANPKFKQYYDSENMTYWGCRLFDNEADARKSFG